MNELAHKFVEYVSNEAPTGSKALVTQDANEKFHLTSDRKVYYCRYFAVRFSYSQSGAFSNTVLSLSALQKYDRLPFFAVLVRKGKSNVVYLANSTFISKISHSSKELSMCNIKGSFNGSDIIKEYAGISNSPDNFDDLFAIHESLDWEDNLLRLVESSSAVKPKSRKFYPDKWQMINLHNSIPRAQDFICSGNFTILNEELNERCNKCKEAILVASHIENVNLRGRIIEYMITSDDDKRERIKQLLKKESQLLPEFETHNDLGDYTRNFDNGRTYTDIKTKVIYLDSAPKAYNVDKFLAKMSESDTSFFFFLIGINENGIFNTALCSVYHDELIDASVVQHHWAGRATRGVVQLSGKTLNDILTRNDFKNHINPGKAEKYIERLIAI